MNVNPFSYLIEKLKGKVDKHDGWLNGIDANTLMSDGFYRLGVANSNLPNISTQKDWSTMYVNSDGTDASQIFISNTSRVFERVKTSGSWGSWNELALKSDIVYPTQRTKLATIAVGETWKDVTPSHNGYLMVNINAGASAQTVTIGVRNPGMIFGTESTVSIEIYHGGYGPIMPCKAGVIYSYFDVHGHVADIDIYECY